MASQDRPIEDDAIAGQTDLPLLVTALTWHAIERIARHEHRGGSRDQALTT
jgi:hypothetical protein